MYAWVFPHRLPIVFSETSNKNHAEHIIARQTSWSASCNLIIVGTLDNNESALLLIFLIISGYTPFTKLKCKISRRMIRWDITIPAPSMAECFWSAFGFSSVRNTLMVLTNGSNAFCLQPFKWSALDSWAVSPLAARTNNQLRLYQQPVIRHRIIFYRIDISKIHFTFYQVIQKRKILLSIAAIRHFAPLYEWMHHLLYYATTHRVYYLKLHNLTTVVEIAYSPFWQDYQQMAARGFLSKHKKSARETQCNTSTSTTLHIVAGLYFFKCSSG